MTRWDIARPSIKPRWTRLSHARVAARALGALMRLMRTTRLPNAHSALARTAPGASARHPNAHGTSLFALLRSAGAHNAPVCSPLLRADQPGEQRMRLILQLIRGVHSVRRLLIPGAHDLSLVERGPFS